MHINSQQKLSKQKLLDIFPTVGRTGKITYNAKLEPIQIAGTMVSAASLNNAEYIMAKDLRINAQVKVKKQGYYSWSYKCNQRCWLENYLNESKQKNVQHVMND